MQVRLLDGYVEVEFSDTAIRELFVHTIVPYGFAVKRSPAVLCDRRPSYRYDGHVSDEETPAQVCARVGHEDAEPIFDYNVDPPQIIGRKCPRCGARLS